MNVDIVQAEGSCAVLVVSGDVDVYTAPRLRERLVELVSEGAHRIVVDLDHVELLDSTGIGVLVGGLKRVRSHEGELSLVCTQQRILKILEVTGVNTTFSIFRSAEAATAAMVQT
jgi:anti-sigma B factor antagonist